MEASWEGEDNSLDQGDGRHWEKDTGSRAAQAVTRRAVLGLEHDCEGDGKVGFQAVVCPHLGWCHWKRSEHQQ